MKFSELGIMWSNQGRGHHGTQVGYHKYHEMFRVLVYPKYRKIFKDLKTKFPDKPSIYMNLITG